MPSLLAYCFTSLHKRAEKEEIGQYGKYQEEKEEKKRVKHWMRSTVMESELEITENQKL